MTSHVYPMHAHEAWTLLIVDDGMIRYDLHGREHGAVDRLVTLLPPQVPHNGRAATSAGFGKRVVYLDLSMLPASLSWSCLGPIDTTTRCGVSASLSMRRCMSSTSAEPSEPSER